MGSVCWYGLQCSVSCHGCVYFLGKNVGWCSCCRTSDLTEIQLPNSLPPSTLYTIHCTQYTVPSILYTVHCTLYPVYCTLVLRLASYQEAGIMFFIPFLISLLCSCVASQYTLHHHVACAAATAAACRNTLGSSMPFGSLPMEHCSAVAELTGRPCCLTARRGRQRAASVGRSLMMGASTL